LLDARIDARGRHMGDAGDDENGAVADETMVAAERQRKGMDADSGRPVAGTAGFAEVVANWSRCGEENDGEIAAGRLRIVSDEPLRDGGQFFVGKQLRNAGHLTTATEATQMIGQTESTMGE